MSAACDSHAASAAAAGNDPRDLDGTRLRTAMHRLGRDPALRGAMIELLRQAEGRLDYPGAVRDDVTGPIADALHGDDDLYRKTLADGTRFDFLFRTKIARDFVMAAGERPTHVWEPQTTRLLLDLARDLDGDVVVGGAYFGDQAILVARHVPAGRAVHCFEPNRAQARMLAGNAKLNGLANVRISGAGLWSSSGVRLKLDGFDSFANAVSAGADDGEAFQTITIDDHRAREGIKIGLIQLDIEGAELAAMQGARATLAEDRPHIVFEVHRHYVDWRDGLAQTEICRLLGSFGYTIFAVRDFNSHREMGDRPVELVPLDAVYLDGPPHGFNMLAVQDPRRVEGPAFRIVENVSPKLLAHKDPALHHPIGGL